ncbi:VapE domain-containing protein [Pandoraea sp. NPDC087047]|uniref:VapE domain-containing protein n=1 Tax=Pandoraea sp. NPDC087047 TaxID=3364390 RepID=UPI0037F4F8FA
MNARATIAAAIDYASLMPTVAQALYGEPTERKANELRFGSRGSLSVKLDDGTWFSHEDNKGGGVLDLIERETGKAGRAAVEWMEQQGIVAVNDNTPAPVPAPRKHVAATYDYVDADGALLFQVCRMEPKDFRQRRPDGKGWSWSVKGIEQVPYRLPELLASSEEIIFVVEGEKDADNMAERGLLATCNAGGANKWRDELTPHFKGRHVVILPDNDDAGHAHAHLVTNKLRGVAASVRVVTLPNLPEKGDVSDWLEAGHGADELRAIVERAIVPVVTDDNLSVDVHSMQMVGPYDFPHMSDKLQPLNTIPNLRHMLSHYGFTVRYDVIRKDLVIRYPGQSGTQDNTRETAVNTVVSLCALNRLPKADAPSFLLNIGDENLVNPVMDFITSNPWDGRSRFYDLLGTVQTRDGYDRNLFALLLRRWLISAVAAAAKPNGFWSKGVLVFQGEQSLGKTAWIRSLLPDDQRDLMKIDATIDPANKDTIISAVSHWICEIGELDGTLRKADIARLKGFISQDVDQFRRPYARTEGKYGRRTVFFASVNPEQFLADDTGNVRWWTVPVAAVNYQHGIDVKQLWAEVYEWFKQGERWWLDRDEEARLESGNDRHRNIDPIEEMILGAYDRDDPRVRKLAASDVLREIGFDKPTTAQARAASKALRVMFGDPKMYLGRAVFAMPHAIRDGRRTLDEDCGRPF